MGSSYDIKKILQLKSGALVELRIKYIAQLWYVEVLGKRTAPYIFPMIQDLFPDLILRSAGPGRGESRITEDYYIEAYQNHGIFSSGPTSEAYNAVRALVGSNARRYVDKAHDIQKRVAEELSEDKTKIQKLRTHYEDLIKKLNTAQKIKFSGLFKEYLNDVAVTKFPEGQAILFPFEPNELFLAFNNDYLGKLLTFTDDRAYADFFLWMNLAALLRNEIGTLMGKYGLSFERKQNVTYDCSFDLKSRERENPAGLADESARKNAIPKCLTPMLPRKPETGLIGRDEIVYEASTQLESKDCIVLVNGLGGIGKTAVMKEVCDRFFTDGRTDTHVAWITCGESLKDDLLILKDPLGVPSDIGREEAAIAVVQKLQGLDGKLYLFLDNMMQKPGNEGMGILNALREHVRIMITSRSKMEGIPSILLDVLEKTPSIDVFYAYYKKDIERNYEDEVWTIIHSDTVRCHTLLIELLAKAAQKTYGTLGDFRKKLEEKGFFDISGSRRFNTGRFDNLTIEESVIKLYDITDLSAEQQRIMRLFSIFTPEKVIYGAVEEWAEFDVNEIDELVERGWLTRTEEGFVIHQIIRDALVRQIGVSFRIEDYWVFLNCVMSAYSYMPRNLAYMKICERLVLAEDVARHLEKRINGIFDIYPLSDNDYDILSISGIMFQNMGYIESEIGDFKNAIEYYKKVVHICSKLYGGVASQHLAEAYRNLANVYADIYDDEMALLYYNKAVSMHERIFGSKHTVTITTYNSIASVYTKSGQFDKALFYYKKVLKYCKERIHHHEFFIEPELADWKHSVKKHLPPLPSNVYVLDDLAQEYNNLAGVYANMGHYKDALKYYKKVLFYAERVLGVEHMKVAAVYNDIAIILLKMDNFETAVDYFWKAFSILKGKLDKEHPDIATIYNNIATALLKQGIYQEAIEYYKKVLAIRTKALGNFHPDTATTYEDMALAFERLGEHEQTLSLIEKSAEIYAQLGLTKTRHCPLILMDRHDFGLPFNYTIRKTVYICKDKDEPFINYLSQNDIENDRQYPKLHSINARQIMTEQGK